MPAPRLFTIIPCAGSSTRLGFDKILTPLKNLSSLDLVLLSLKEAAKPFKTIIPVAPGREEEFIKKIHFPATIIQGGACRAQSIKNALLEIEKDNPKPNDLILIHDGARPFVESATIKKTIAAALENGAAISALPVKDTIKEATKDCQFIAKTPPRQLLFAATTPQIFSFEILEKAYATKKDLSSFTDDAQLIETELPEVKIKIVPDTPKNFKITTQEDWDFALWLISHAR